MTLHDATPSDRLAILVGKESRRRALFYYVCEGVPVWSRGATLAALAPNGCGWRLPVHTPAAADAARPENRHEIIETVRCQWFDGVAVDLHASVNPSNHHTVRRDVGVAPPDRQNVGG